MADTNASKTWMMLFSAVGFGIVAAVLSVLYLNSREAAIIASLVGEEDQIISVVVPTQNVPEGTRLTEEFLSLLDIPSKYVPDGAITAQNYANYLGRYLSRAATEGKPLLVRDLTEVARDFSDLINKDKRALTVQVDEVKSISGLVRPGNHIDIYVIIQAKIAGFQPVAFAASELPGELLEAAKTGELPAEIPEELLAVQETPKDVIIPVVQDVRVLATGREAYDAYLDQYQLPQRRLDSSFTAMTLDVSPQQAALLSLADDKGDLVAILRNRADRGLAEFDGLTPFDLVREAKKMKELAALKKAAAAAGATIDENGNWVTADGRVIKGDDIVISADGTVTTKGGELLGAKGISVNANGEYVDENGNVINPDDIVINPDGTITTKQALMEAAGYTLNENGDYVDADGNVINPDDVMVLANGTIMTKDGKVLSGPNVTVNKDGFIIAADGTVMTADGKVLEGVTVDENGNVIGPDGKIMTDSNLTVAVDGTVRDSNGNVIAGITGSDVVTGPGLEEQLMELLSGGKSVRLIIGGKSKDGKAPTVDLPVESVKQAPPR